MPKSLLKKLKNIKVSRELIAYISLILIPLLAYTVIFVLPKNPRFKKARQDSNYIFIADGKNFDLQVGLKDGNHPQVDFQTDSGQVTFNIKGLEFVELSDPEQERRDTVSFRDVQNNIDLRYTTLENGIKEEIILNERGTRNTFWFDLDIEGAHIEPISEGFVDPVLYDQNGDYLFHFVKPYAYDEAGIETEEVSIQLLEKDNGFLVEVSINQEWLDDKDREYPVYIDPTIIHDTTGEFALGEFNRNRDVGSPQVESYYQPLSADEHTVGLWHMDETGLDSCSGGEDLCDSSGYDNHGVDTSTSIVSGHIDNARSIGGAGSNIVVTNSAELSSTEMTIEYWVNSSADDIRQINKYNAVTPWPGYGVGIGDGSNPGLAKCWAGGGSWVFGTSKVNDGQWHHLACTANSTQVQVYVDGTLEATAAQTTSIVDTIDLNIGWDSDSLLDELRISNVVRTSEEIYENAKRSKYSVFTSPVLDLTTPTTAWNSLSWSEIGVGTGDGETVFDNTGLVAQWNFNEISGTTANNDAEGTSCGGTPANCDGTLSGFDSTASQDADPDSSWTADNRKWGAGALQFDGVDSYTYCTHANCGASNQLGFTNTDSFTYSTWFKTSASGTQVIFGKKQQTGISAGYMLQQASDDSLKCRVGDGTTTIVGSSGTKTYNDGNWHYATCVHDASNISIYINGQHLETNDTSALGSYTNADNFIIGEQATLASVPFKGVIDDVQVYSRALGADEILSNYNSSNIQVQTRVGADTTPNDGSWDDWSPNSGETLVEGFETDIDPTDISDLRLWLDANDISTITKDGSDNVSQWNDKSGNAYHLIQSTASQQPNYTTGVVNGKPTIRFTASTSDTMTEATNFGTACTVIYVSKQTGGSNLRMLAGLSNNWLLGYWGGNKRSAYFEGWVYNSTVPSDTNWHIFSTTIGGAGINSNVYENGSLFVGNTTGVDCPNGLSLNGYLGTSEFSDADIAEVIAYDRMLSRDELWKVESYLANKYALEVNSPIKTSIDPITKLENTSSRRLELKSAAVDPNTVAYWNLDETNGDNVGFDVFDATDNNYDGQFGGTDVASAVIDGVSGKARELNGTDDFIQLPNSSVGGGNFTVETWFKVLSTPGNQNPIIEIEDGFNDYTKAIVIRFDAANKIRYQIRAGGTNLEILTSNTFNLNQWYHVALVRSGNTGTLYVDGKYNSSGTVTGTSNPVGSNWHVGKTNSAVPRYVNMGIDEIRISDIARTPEELARSYEMGRGATFQESISATDFSTKSMYAYDIASDRTGTFLNQSTSESTYASYLTDANTIAFWNMNEHNNNTCNIGVNDVCDSSGNLNHGNQSGTTPPEPNGIHGYGRDFAGVDDYVDFGDITAMSTPSAFSFSTWFKRDVDVNNATNHAIENILIAKSSDTVNDNLEIGTNGTVIDLYVDTVGTDSFSFDAGIQDDTWYHLVATYDSADTEELRLYLNGKFIQSWNTPSGALTGSTAPLSIGIARPGVSNWGDYDGIMDEVRLDNVARTPTEIRQAYQNGRSSHPITIDFGASLDSGNLILNSTDYSFTIDATVRGLAEKGTHLFTGDKLIVKENIDGVEYIAQGTVTAIAEATGVTTVASWDSGSTFPSGGYTANATIFKWQTEYIDLSHIRSDDDNAITDLTYRITNGNEGRNIWIDNMRSVSSHLTDRTGSTITSALGNRYFQYRSIFSSADGDVSASLTSLTLDYANNTAPTAPTITPALLPSSLKTVGSTPTINFTSTDSQLDDITYQIQWDTDSDFLAATTKISSTDPGFINIEDSADTDPFTHNQVISYTWQTALTNGTYFYKVRAFDGADYSNWSEIRSITIDTGVDRNSWYQTHADQFKEGAAGPNINIDDATNSVKISTGTDTLLTQMITSSEFEFESRWGELTFTDIETTGSILYKIYYDVPGDPNIWGFKKEVTITYSGTAKTDYDVLLEIDTAALITANKMQTDCDDIKLLDSDDSTTLIHWIEGGCNTTTTQIWTRVPSIPDGGKVINLYYGKAAATNTEESWTGEFVTLNTGSCPTGWTAESGASGAYENRFPYAASSYGTSGGSSTHGHDQASCTVSGATVGWGRTGGGRSWAPQGHSHTNARVDVVDATSLYPPYLEVVYCSRSSLEIEADQVTVFDATVPTGWTRFSALDDNFPLGAATYGGSGGAETHTHTTGGGYTTGSSGANVTGNLIETPNNVSGNHTHTTSSGNTNSGSNLPTYTDVIFGQADAQTASPVNAVFMSSAVPPLGWTRISALDDTYIRGASAYGGTGGTSSHTHPITIATGTGSVNTTLTATGDGYSHQSHTHSCSTTSSSTANTPPYIETVFAKKNSNTADGVSLSLGSEIESEATGAIIVPDSALPGNSVGFGTSPVDLTTLDTATYSALYIEASLTYSGGSPELQDWEVTLNKTPNLPTQDLPTDGSRTTTLTPYLKTTASDNDADWLRYKVDLCMNRSMTVGCQTFDQTSSQTGWSGQNVEGATAYGSGIQATYTLQANLQPGTTYYWRSYATDPIGDSQWSSTQSDPYWFMTNSKPRSASSDMYEHYISRSVSDTISSTQGWSTVSGTADLGTTASTNGWIDDTNLTTGDRYLVMAWGTHNTDNVDDRSGIRVTHGGTPFSESETIEETDRTATWYKTPYFWFTVWTAQAGEDIEMDIYWANEGATSARFEDLSLLAINAEYLITNGDLQYSIDTTGEGLTTSFVTTESLNLSSSATSRWLTMGYNQWDINTIDAEVRALLDINGTDQAWSGIDGEDTNDTPLYGFGAVSELGVNPTVSIESSVSTGSSTMLSEGLMALNLSAFEQISFDTFDSAYEITSAILDWEEVLLSDLITNISTSWIHLGGSLVDDNGNRTMTRIQSNDSSITDVIGGWQPQADNIIPQNIFDLQVAYSGTKKVDYEAYRSLDVIPNAQILNPWLVAISMEKYNTGTRRDAPTDSANNQNIYTAFQITSIDPDDDKVRHKIDICEDSGMTTNCQTFDQTSSQTGWSGQNALANTAYDSGSTATYTVQTALSYNTTHYWKSYAIDNSTGAAWTSEQTTPYSFTTTQQPSAPTLLEAELQTNPTAVDDDTPEFSAIHSDPDGDSALFYQIEVNTNASFTGTTMWDSTKTATNVASGNRSSLYIYAGSGLDFNGTTYYWRIKFWDSNNGESTWSSTAQFTTAVLESPAPCSLEEAADDSQITINWADKNTIEDSYEIDRSVNGGSFTFLISKLAGVITHIDSTVTQGNTYAYRLYTKKGGATSDYCTTSTLDLQIGSLQLEGLQLEGIQLD